MPHFCPAAAGYVEDCGEPCLGGSCLRLERQLVHAPYLERVPDTDVLVKFMRAKLAEHFGELEARISRLETHLASVAAERDALAAKLARIAGAFRYEPETTLRLVREVLGEML